MSDENSGRKNKIMMKFQGGYIVVEVEVSSTDMEYKELEAHAMTLLQEIKKLKEYDAE